MTPTVTTSTAPEPSIAELRAMLNDSEPTTLVTKAEPVAAPTETPEPEVEAKPAGPQRGPDGKFVKADEGNTETEPGTVQTKEPEPTVEDKEEPLPANVQKRIAKEVARQAQIDREIAQAVSATKAKQAELQRLRDAADTSGPEPVKTTEPAKEGKPVKPKFGREGQTWGDWQNELDAYEEKNEAWLMAEGRRQAREELLESRWQESVEKTIELAKKAHGEKFDELRATVVYNTPEGLQNEIGTLEDWPSMIMYLGDPDNAAEMEKLGALYQRNPSAAIRELGRIEDRLKKPEPKETEPVATGIKTKPLPPPPAKVGGGSDASPQVDLEKADMRTFKREIKALLER